MESRIYLTDENGNIDIENVFLMKLYYGYSFEYDEGDDEYDKSY